MSVSVPPHAAFHDEVVRAVLEDVGSGDITTEATIAADAKSCAVIGARSGGIVCGMAAAVCVFDYLGGVESTPTFADGASVQGGEMLLELFGSSRTILTGERVALNFLQHLSGIATLTRKFVDAVAGTKARIADTRKTTPGLRSLEKYAVRVGGGVNHRFGLYDAVLIKENHIAAAGGIAVAVERVRQRAGFMMKIEVETRTFAEVEGALKCGVDVIMLDNMSVQTVREAVAIINGRAIVEASGNVTLDIVRAIAETGVDIISVGALTHSAPALDMTLQICSEREIIAERNSLTTRT